MLFWFVNTDSIQLLPSLHLWSVCTTDSLTSFQHWYITGIHQWLDCSFFNSDSITHFSHWLYYIRRCMSRSITSPLHWQHPVRHTWIHNTTYTFFSIHIIAYSIWYIHTESMSRRHTTLRSPLHFPVQNHCPEDHIVVQWCAPSPVLPTASQRLRFLRHPHNTSIILWL